MKYARTRERMSKKWDKMSEKRDHIREKWDCISTNLSEMTEKRE